MPTYGGSTYGGNPYGGGPQYSDPTKDAPHQPQRIRFPKLGRLRRHPSGGQWTRPWDPYYATIWADTPVGYWRLADTVGGGFAFDEIQNNTLPTVSGAGVTFQQASGLYRGQNTFSTSFSQASNGKLSKSATLNNLPQGTAAVTFEAWVKPTTSLGTSGAGGTILQYGTGSLWNTWQIYNGAGSIYLYTDGVNVGNNITISSSICPPVGVWSHVVFRFHNNGSTAWDYYLNGVQQTSGTNSANLTGTLNSMAIGNRQDTSGQGWDGGLQDVALYNYALTPTQITNHYNAGANPYAWWMAADQGLSATNGGSPGNWIDNSGRGTWVLGGSGTTYKDGAHGQYGLPLVNFNGSGKYTNAGAVIQQFPQTYMALVRPTSTATQMELVSSSAAGAWEITLTGADHAPQGYLTLVKTSTAVLATYYPTNNQGANDWVLVTITTTGSGSGTSASSTASTVRINGQQALINGSYTGSGFTGNADQLFYESGGSAGFIGDVAEVIMWGRILTATEISTWEAYLQAKWNVTWRRPDPIRAAARAVGRGLVRRKPNTVNVPVAQAAAPVNPAITFSPTAPKALRGRAIRRRIRPEVVPKQLNPPYPHHVEAAPKAIVRGRKLRKGKISEVVPPQFNPPIVNPPTRRSIQARTKLLRPKKPQVEVVPPQFNPPFPHAVVKQTPRRGRLRRPVRPTEAPITQTQQLFQALPPSAYRSIAARAKALRAFRTRVEIVPPQINPPFVRSVVTQPHAVRGRIIRRPKVFEVTPLQTAPVNPAIVFNPSQKRTVRGLLRRKGTTPTYVNPQSAAPVNPAIVFRPARSILTKSRVFRRKGAGPQVVPAQVIIPNNPSITFMPSRAFRGRGMRPRGRLMPDMFPVQPQVTFTNPIITHTPLRGRLRAQLRQRRSTITKFYLTGLAPTPPALVPFLRDPLGVILKPMTTGVILASSNQSAVLATTQPSSVILLSVERGIVSIAEVDGTTSVQF